VSADSEPEIVPGFVDSALRAEFPGLRLAWVNVAARMRQSPRELRRRLMDLSSRYRGADVIAMRTHAIPHAYRAFFRQTGVDPDVTRIPSEEAAVGRLLHGQFVTANVIDDALLIALIETGVPVWALDAGAVAPGGLGIRLSVGGERLGGGVYAGYLSQRQLVVADTQRVHAVLFGEIVPEHRVTPRTDSVVLFAVGVDGVPTIHVEEALWLCIESLGS
jgi:DNA/RNA-binding domain of Phe-tRNA-synthetase-like protein